MTLNQGYIASRLIGYAAGVVGILLFVSGRNSEESRELIQTIGAGLVAVMFVAFLASYVFFTLLKIRRRSGSSRADFEVK